MGNDGMYLRLRDFRVIMEAHGLEAFLLQNTDEYQSEQVPDNLQRVRWLSGFSGSNAMLIVCRKGKNKFYTDGRYALQADIEVDKDYFDVYDLSKTSPADWLSENLPDGKVVGYDGELFSLRQIKKYEKFCLKMLPFIAIDQMWHRCKAVPQQIVEHSIEFTGLASCDKRATLASNMGDCEAVLITDTDAISWLLNIRNLAFKYNPTVLSRAILYCDGSADLFVADVAGVKIENPGVNARPMDELLNVLKGLNNLAVDEATIPMSIFCEIKDRVSSIGGESPCSVAKATKNATEIAGMKKAHIRDGVAIVNFLYWLENKIACGETVTELDASHKVSEFRGQQEMFLGESFETISGYRGNGAIVHYRASESSNKVIEPDGLYLVDSGGQYCDGTTDITRTVAVGSPTIEEMTNFTLVLKGFISLARAVFPEGTAGGSLDVLARQHLWREGLDYGHSTGHGVGSFLSVHEGPQAIAPRNTVGLLPGMVLSNEPGYYKQGAYGIRVENLMYVERGSDGFCKFQQLTCVPIDKKMIMRNMLSDEEREFIDRYHSFVYESIASRLDGQVKSWLDDACKRL